MKLNPPRPQTWKDKICSPQKNFSQPLGAQTLRLRQELRGILLGPLAVPRQKELAVPSLPPASLPQVLLEASAIRASRLEKFLRAENLFLYRDAKRPSPRAESDSGSIEILRGGVGKPQAPRHDSWRGERRKGLPTTARLDFLHGIRLRPGRWAFWRQRPRRGEKFSPLVLLLSFFVFQVNVYAQGTVKGRVVFEGTPPSAETVEVKSDIPTCGTTKEIQKIVLGKDQGVANAVVKIIGAKGTLESKKGTLDQVNCEFVPHVQVLPVGSTLILTSSDPVLHNSHGFYEDGSTAFNIAVPIMGMEVSQKLNRAGVIKLRCDAGHTWMSAYVVVTDEPFYAVTDADGNFQIDGIPAGSYEIEVWQEWLGTHRQPIEVKGEAEPLMITLRKS